MSPGAKAGLRGMREPTDTKNLDIYGHAPLEWSRVRDELEAGWPRAETPIFLGTVRPDGRPHAAGIGAAWHDGEAYFVSGPNTQKSRNVAANPACTISARLGTPDLVLGGEAPRG